MSVNIQEIMGMIPHRYPFLLIDRVTDIELNKSAVGVKNVSFNEPQFQGHFPNYPVMPGVLIVEAMAQLSAILVAKSVNANADEQLVYFMSIDNAKFRKIVSPGDKLIIKSEILQHRNNVWKFKSVAEVDGAVVAESEFKAMVKDK